MIMRFKKIEPTDFATLQPFFQRQPYELCEYSLATLIVWSNEEYQPRAAVKNDTLYLMGDFVNRRELRHLMLPLCRQRSFPPEDLAVLARQLDIPRFWFVPECYLNTFGRRQVEHYFIIEEQTAYNDYVYGVKALSTLAGNRYAKKRNLINQFRKNHAPESLQFEPIAGHNITGCLDFLEEWCATRKCEEGPDDSLSCEKQALVKMLNNFQLLNSTGLVLRINGKISAMGISSYLTPEMRTLQFEKAFEYIKGLYQYFDQQCIQRLFQGYSFVNKESDMGIKGLTKAKKSYYPLRRIKSFLLRLRDAG